MMYTRINIMYSFPLTLDKAKVDRCIMMKSVRDSISRWTHSRILKVLSI